MSVSTQMLGYGQTETSLFQAGILESGSALTLPFFPIETAWQPLYETVVNQTGWVTRRTRSHASVVSRSRLSTPLRRRSHGGQSTMAS